jgi:hypothetical protein
MNRVILVQPSGVSRIHPAVARRMLAKGRAVRLPGARFRVATPEVAGQGTLLRLANSRSGGRLLHRLTLRFTNPLLPSRVVVRDARYPRGFSLDALLHEHGETWRNAAANHGTHAKPLLSWSLGRDPRTLHVTVLATDHGAAWGLLDAIQEDLAGKDFQIQRGWEHFHETRCVSAWRESVRARGCYVGVVAGTAAEAMGMVPGATRSEFLGPGGRRGESSSWKVWTKRTHRLPLQVGPCGSYGCGTLH